MTAEEFAKSLGINGEGISQGNTYTVSLSNSNEYSRVYTILDKAKGIDLDDEESVLSESSTLLVYLADDFDIKLKADLDKNIYTVSFEPVSEGDKDVTKDNSDDEA